MRRVHEKATELLVLLSGIANLYTGAGEAVTPGGAVIWERDDGIRDVHIFQTPMRVRARMGTMAMDPTVVESWLALARQDDKVLDALRFFQEDTSWWSLRKAYEILEKDEFKQQSRVAQILSTPEEEIRRFKEWTSYYTMYTAAVDSTQTGSTLQHARPGAQVRRRYARKPNRNAQVHVAP